MTGYTSGKTHRDPYPNVFDGHTPRNQMRTDTNMYREGAPVRFPGYSFRPRPEYDNHNPILVAFREDFAQHSRSGNLARYAAEYLRFWGELAPKGGAPEHINHARRVLSRLASIGGAS